MVDVAMKMEVSAMSCAQLGTMMRAVGMNKCMELCRELGVSWLHSQDGGVELATKC